MKQFLTKLSLAAAAILLLGSCAKINERIDKLEGRIDGSVEIQDGNIYIDFIIKASCWCA